MRLECHSLCSNYTCPENAECFINTFNNPQCKCKSSDKYVYSGEDCGVAVEKLALGVNEIIAIAVSVGLAAIILTILIVLAIVYRRRRHKKSPTSSDESDFETRQSPLDGAAPLQPALYGRFETLRLPRVSRQPSQLKRQSSLAYQESIYPPDARFPYSGSDIAGRQSAGESQGRFRDIRASQFGRGLPLAHNPRANWNARWSSWSDGGESA
nr:interphotoreceptor matrix proteoglycan 2-like; partial [Biomphalaria glabrata]